MLRGVATILSTVSIALTIGALSSCTPQAEADNPMAYGVIEGQGNCYNAPNFPYGVRMILRNSSPNRTISFTVLQTPPGVTTVYPLNPGATHFLGCSKVMNPPTEFGYKIVGAVFS
jgi:hypothetical protein